MQRLNDTWEILAPSLARHHYGLYKKEEKKKWKTGELYIRSENMNSGRAINIDHGKSNKLQDTYIVVKLQFLSRRKNRRNIIAPRIIARGNFPFFNYVIL